jgi:hypothetical protein
MNRIVKRLMGTAALSLVLGVASWADEEGAMWLERIDTAERVPYSVGVATQVITTSGGTERTLTMKTWTAENGDLSLMAYTEPARVRGDKILLRDGGDTIWYYMKRRDVIRHFAGHTRRQSVMGSDFSYEDLAQGDLTEDYSAEVVGREELDGVPCVQLRCVPTEEGPSYDHLILWAGEDDHLTRKIDYYDGDGLVKTLLLSSFTTVDGRKVAMKLEMMSRRDSSHTVMTYESLSFKNEPDPEIFTKRALTREQL